MFTWWLTGLYGKWDRCSGAIRRWSVLGGLVVVVGCAAALALTGWPVWVVGVLLGAGMLLYGA